MRPPEVFVRPLAHEEALRLKRLAKRAKHESTREPLAFMAQIRASYPTRRRIYWIQDNLSANWTPDIRSYAGANNIELVATPTYASYLNPVECHFSAISEFVLCNADYLDWDAFAFALARHVSYRNGEHRNRRLIAAENRRRIAA